MKLFLFSIFIFSILSTPVRADIVYENISCYWKYNMLMLTVPMDSNWDDKTKEEEAEKICISLKDNEEEN